MPAVRHSHYFGCYAAVSGKLKSHVLKPKAFSAPQQVSPCGLFLQVELCTRTDKHPRGSCPFAHVGDVAHRRHPSRYQALLCPEVRAVSGPAMSAVQISMVAVRSLA